MSPILPTIQGKELWEPSLLIPDELRELFPAEVAQLTEVDLQARAAADRIKTLLNGDRVGLMQLDDRSQSELSNLLSPGVHDSRKRPPEAFPNGVYFCPLGQVGQINHHFYILEENGITQIVYSGIPTFASRMVYFFPRSGVKSDEFEKHRKHDVTWEISPGGVWEPQSQTTEMGIHKPSWHTTARDEGWEATFFSGQPGAETIKGMLPFDYVASKRI
jgi:hypothetical protein